MVAFAFDASNIDPSVGGGVLPGGEYIVTITASEFKPTRSGTGSYLQLDLTVQDGPQRNRKFIHRINTHNQNADASRIGAQELSAVCHVIGVIQFQDTAQLHGRPFRITLSEEPRADDPTKTGNELIGLTDMNGNPPKAGILPGAPQAAHFAQPPQQQQPQAQPPQQYQQPQAQPPQQYAQPGYAPPAPPQYQPPGPPPAYNQPAAGGYTPGQIGQPDETPPWAPAG